MEVLLSAVANDLVGRLISLLVRKYQEPGAAEDAVRLLRARAVVEEAEGRQIANRAMLVQLNQLRREMCHGVYVLDALRWRTAADPGKRLATSMASIPPLGTGGLSVAESLEAALSDMREFVVLLGACPRVARQPYSTYLFMESCMFGRQMEKEHIIDFLLHSSQDLDVLPIIGPREVGKRTLVEHVCLDERVREHFAKIHRLSSDNLVLPSHDHEHHLSLIDGTARSLIVIDLAGSDAGDEERWRRFRSSVGRRAHRENKIILISRAEEAHAGLGTVPPLRLRASHREELWYFFRAIAFGGADPEERPELLRVAMALFDGIHDPAPFAAASIIAASLRADLSAGSWRHVLNVFAGATNEPGFFLCRPVKGAPGVPCSFYDRRKSTGTARSELPKVTVLDLETGGAVLPRGETRFDVLAWQSRIPPYVSYVTTCDMERARQAVAVEKRVHKRRGQQDEERDELAEMTSYKSH